MPDLSSIALEKQKHPTLSAESPFNIDFMYVKKPSEKYSGDIHYALQLGICLTGGVEVLYDNFSRVFTPGECWWTMCWEPHACRGTEKRSFAVAVNLEMNSLGSVDPFGGCHWLLPFTLPPEERYIPGSESEKAKFLEAGKKLFHWNHRRGAYWQQKSWLLINDLLLTAMSKLNRIQPAIAEQAVAASDRFARLRPAIELARSSGTEPVTLAKAAKACSLSSSRFSELFREALGSSYGQFAARARISQAARDIATSNMAVEEVAAKWGFFDSSHFCHAFKKIYQCSPSEFRRRRNENESMVL
ncbi:MAG: helix-turn-helix transcriptional regulator [Lentisphaeria bacterium]|nr:helix-turn-helix transcriptional regulator [Lentisphaeria bacterium]